MGLDTRLDFNLHLKNIQNKVNKTTGLFRKLQNTLPRTSLIAIFKSFIRPHLGYEDIIYDRAYNTSFHQNIESIEFNAALVITGAVRGTSRDKLYQESPSESLQHRCCYRKFCCLFKVINNQSPRYLFQLVASPNITYFSRNSENIPQLCIKHNFLKKSFFPSAIKEWNNLECKSENPKALVFSKAIF